MRYDTDEYARSRLLNTIVLHKGKPVEVGHIEDGKAILQVLGAGGVIKAPLSELDLSPIRLGYVNHGGGAHYLKRLPKRRDWRQGLRDNNINKPELLHLGVARLCEGTYPSFKEACAMVEIDHHCVAFSRQFAVDDEGEVEYRGSSNVGHLDEGLGVDLLQQYEYLAEALKEAMYEH